MRRIARFIGLATILLLVPACASAPPKAITDFSDIVGRWAGTGGFTASGPSANGPVELTIRNDRSGEFFLPQLNGGTRVPVSFTMSDGKVLYETATSKGTMTLQEGGGTKVLLGEAIRKDGTSKSWFEVKPAK